MSFIHTPVQRILSAQGPLNLRRRLELLPYLGRHTVKNSPPSLLVCGSPEWLAGTSQKPERLRVGVIGTRKPSSYGLRFVEEIVKAVRDLPIVMVSGGALGIDGELHYQALRYGLPTEAWLVGPVLAPSPRTHEQLFEVMRRKKDCGLIVPEELEPNSRPLHVRDWLTRNQWLSLGLDALIVVEAGIYSGTWATVKFSQNLGIPIFALPGMIFSEESKGTNLMISSGYAHPVEGVGFLCQELVALLGPNPYNKGRGEVDSAGVQQPPSQERQ